MSARDNTSVEQAEDEGARACRRMVELDENPYTRDPADEERFFNPPATRAWERGWRKAKLAQLREARP